MRDQWIRLWAAFFVGLGLGVGAEASSREQVLGQVRLSGGLPVAGAQVILFDLADLRRGVVAQTTTDALGSFALPLGRRPNGVVLGQNYPNPFNPSTVIPYELSSSSWVRLEVFNLLGQRLALLVDGEQGAGVYRARWDGTDLSGRAAAAGVYLYRLTVGESSQTGRMVLVDGQAGVPLGGSGVEVVPSLGFGESYGLVVLGDGIVAYVDADFEMESGLVAIEMASARGARGKASQEGILGDVNNNGRVDADDALLVMAYSLKGSVSLPDGGDISLGDVDRDGSITVTDAWLIATYVVNPADPVLPLGIGNPLYAFDQTVAQIQALEAELERNRKLIEEAVAEQLRNHPLNAPKDQFESDADYAARISQLDSVRAQSYQELGEQYGLDSIQVQITRLYRSFFPAGEGTITTTLGEYNANEGYFPITFETMLNGESQRLEEKLSLNTDEARSLYENWGNVTIKGFLSIDPGYRQALAYIQLEYAPIWPKGIRWEFNEVYHLGDNNVAAAFSPDGKYIVTASQHDRMATLWDMSSGQIVRQMEHGTNSGDYIYAVAFSPDGRYFGTGGEDRDRRLSSGKMVLWDVNSGRKVREQEFADEVEAIIFSPDGQHLVSITKPRLSTNRMFLWRIGSNQRLYYDLNGSSDTADAIAFSPDGKYIVAGHTRERISQLDRVILLEVGSATVESTTWVQPIEHTGVVNAVAFSPDGKYIVTGGYLRRGEDRGVVTFWEVTDAPIQEPGQSLLQVEHENHIHFIAFSPDGKYLAVGEHGGTITFYQIPEEITITTEIAVEKTIKATGDTDLAWSSDGRFISDSNKVYRMLLDP